jgi:hypothetical protein
MFPFSILAGMAKFTRRDVTRAIKAATAAGLSNFRIEISPLDGKIVISTDSTQNNDRQTDDDGWKVAL